MSFGDELLKSIPDSISILLVPTVVGGSSIEQWIEDKKHRGVQLFSNFQEKIRLGSDVGTFKGVLWHQGEKDVENEKSINAYNANLKLLVDKFRATSKNQYLPICNR